MGQPGGGPRMVFCRDGEQVNVYTASALVDGKEMPLDYVKVTDYAKRKTPPSRIDTALKQGGQLADPLAIGLVPVDFFNTGHFRRDAMFRRADVASSGRRRPGI